MDVGTPSNFERLMAIFDDDHSKISAMITGAVATDEDIRSTMAGVHAATGMLVDPHTAAGILGAQSFTESEGNGDTTIVSLATAHPAKFGEIVVDACGVEPDLPPALARAMTLEKRSLLVEPDTEALRHYLLHHQ
jgi:threonine synthase